MQQQDSGEGIRVRGLIWLCAFFACLSGSAILTRERDWGYMLTMTLPFLALFVGLLCLAFLGWLNRRKEHKRSSMPLTAAIVAAAQEKFNAVQSSKGVQADNSGVQRAILNEPMEDNVPSVALNESMDRDALYAMVLAAMAWLWLLAALPFLTDAACQFPVAGVLAITWMILALAWLCGLLLAQSVLRSSSARRWWLSAGLAGLLGLLLAFTDVGFLLRVAISERALNAYVAAVPAGTTNAIHSIRQVGLFLVDGTEESNGVVVLYTSSSFLDRQGVAFVPEGVIPPQHLSMKHLFGPWYSFRWRF
jgi:hypothetical protein